MCASFFDACDRRRDSSAAPEMRGELPAVEGVTAEEGEDAAGSAVSAAHPLGLQLQVELQRPVRRHLRQGRLGFERSRAERVRLRSDVNEEPVGCLCLADLQGNQPMDSC